MTSRKTSFFLYLMPSDLQETALVTVAGGLGAPVSSLWPSWVMYLRFEKRKSVQTLRRNRSGRWKTTLGRDEFSHNNKGEQRVSGLIREDRLTRFSTQRGKPTVGCVSIALYLKRSLTVAQRWKEMISENKRDGCSVTLSQKFLICAQSQVLAHSATTGAQVAPRTQTSCVNMRIMKNYKTSMRAFELVKSVGIII